MSRKPAAAPVSTRTELRAALASLEATRLRTQPIEALREWRVNTARHYVRAGRPESTRR